MQYLTESADTEPTPIWPVHQSGLETWLTDCLPEQAAWIRATDFKAKPDSHLLVPRADGSLAGVLAGIAEESDLWTFAGLPAALPIGTYRLVPEPAADRAGAVALGWLLGTYDFDRYKTGHERRLATLVRPTAAVADAPERTAAAIFLVRDLINTPTADLGPDGLAAAAAELAETHGAPLRVTIGDELLARNFPMIHAVGRAAAVPPRLIDFTWGDPNAPKVTLVGKGVCFDSGGLDIKTAAGMELMRKDMGGAANVLGLASMVMAAGLPVRLRVLIPAVENAVSGNAFRPGDVLGSHKGLTVEIGNTDAEGRLILADALAAADTEVPELLIDMATLTGAARVAVGVELAATFTDDEQLAADLARHGAAEADPLWRMPLWSPYRKLLDSKFADIRNIGDGRYAGAITGALFLKEFVDQTKSWVHFDIMAWNIAARPGRPVGGEAYAIRALYALIEEKFGTRG